ncbi:Hypothetical protein, putative [Bodo saltans]|uniref:Phenazine biosynthesis protein n=1 Tax=Bodo saltans TaxID=75058 RepID=A0A0S4J7I1_BODSA|nr:Hypothetical protein, putative [Bodo saltans]|eukprot:CUG86437.1 Hypothetical protein, putative [Bodo saltans]
MTSVPLFLVDSFTTEVFRGNPAGVVLIAAAAICGSSEAPQLPLQDKNEKTTTTVAEESRWIWSGVCSDSILQACASELNLSETVFLVPFLRSDENNKIDDTSLSSFPQVSCTAAVNNAFLIRWFTPDREVGLCGHATLAAAHILFTAAPPSFFGTDLPLGNVVKFFNDASGWVSVSRGGIAEKKNEEGNLTTAPHRTPVVEAVGEQQVVVASGEYIINFPLRTPYVLWKSEGGTSRSSNTTTTASTATLSVLGDICASVGLTVDDADEFCLHDGSRKYLLVVKGGVDVIQRATPNIATMREVFACCVAESSSPAHPLVPLAPLSLTITSRTECLEAVGRRQWEL